MQYVILSRLVYYRLRNKHRNTLFTPFPLTYHCTKKPINFSLKDFFRKKATDLLKFTKKILNEKLYFLYSVRSWYTGRLLAKQNFASFSVLLWVSSRKLTKKMKFCLTCGDSSAVCKNSPVNGPNKIPDFCNSVTWNEKLQMKGKIEILLI